MSNMESVLYGESQDESKVEAEQVEQVQEQAETQDQGEPNEAEAGAPTAQSTDKHVPLAALEAERGQRRDWKEKALKYEGQLEEMRRQQAAQQPQQAQVNQAEQNPFEQFHRMIINERFNTSERDAKRAYPDLSEKVEVFKQAMDKNPALYAQMVQNPDPWDFAYKEGARMLLAKEMGDDPTAYKDRVRAELEAEILAKHGLSPAGQAAPALNLPKSLAGARSSAVRSAPTFTGPTPLDQMLN